MDSILKMGGVAVSISIWYMIFKKDIHSASLSQGVNATFVLCVGIVVVRHVVKRGEVSPTSLQS